MTPDPTLIEQIAWIICRIFGHRWTVFHAEQCPAEYRKCRRCEAIKHACNDVRFK